MTTLNYYTMGESHGPCLLAVVNGLPYGTAIDVDFINNELARRQGGYGRGARMKVEKDTAEIISGVRKGKTLGSPVTLMIKNKVANSEDLPEINKPRPGHADLAGAMKFGIQDARDISERASARETVARVSAGALANHFLSLFYISVCGYVVEIGGISSNTRINVPQELKAKRESSLFYCLDESFDQEIKAKVDKAKEDGDTLGGVFEIIAFNVPPGLGTFAGWDNKLDGALAKALMSVQTVKAVEIGAGFSASKIFGSQMHDEITVKGDGKIGRKKNNAGGIEGGMSNGEPIVARAACKPISTLRKGLGTVTLDSKEETQAQYERSDVCVVPAASVIGEAVVAFEIAKVFLDKFGGDTFEETQIRYNTYKENLKRIFSKNE